MQWNGSKFNGKRENKTKRRRMGRGEKNKGVSSLVVFDVVHTACRSDG